jgi:hypothetical protein
MLPQLRIRGHCPFDSNALKVTQTSAGWVPLSPPGYEKGARVAAERLYSQADSQLGGDQWQG